MQTAAAGGAAASHPNPAAGAHQDQTSPQLGRPTAATVAFPDMRPLNPMKGSAAGMPRRKPAAAPIVRSVAISARLGSSVVAEVLTCKSLLLYLEYWICHLCQPCDLSSSGGAHEELCLRCSPLLNPGASHLHPPRPSPPAFHQLVGCRAWCCAQLSACTMPPMRFPRTAFICSQAAPADGSGLFAAMLARGEPPAAGTHAGLAALAAQPAPGDPAAVTAFAIGRYRSPLARFRSYRCIGASR